MALTKETIVDQITILDNGIILYREATSILENDVEISKNYHRTSLIPGQDISNQPEKVIAICNTLWTPEVVTAYQTKLAEERAKIGEQV